MTRTGPRLAALVLAVEIVAGCASDPIVAPAHAIEARAQMPQVHLAATLSVQNGCPLLNDASGSLLPIWPEGVNLSGDTLRMREAPVVRVGDIVELGGHWVALEDVVDELIRPLPAGCAGTGRVFWVDRFEFGI